jgi:hypothetical protein
LKIKGRCRNGVVELDERPEGIEEAEVLVTFSDLATAAQAEDRERLRQEAFAQMEKGLQLGGGPYYEKREDLYAEPIERDAGQAPSPNR